MKTSLFHKIILRKYSIFIFHLNVTWWWAFFSFKNNGLIFQLFFKFLIVLFYVLIFALSCLLTSQAADLPWIKNFYKFWSVWLPELLRGHTALLAAADWGQLSFFQLIPQLHTRCRCAACDSLLSAQRKSEGKTAWHPTFWADWKMKTWRPGVRWSFTAQDSSLFMHCHLAETSAASVEDLMLFA